jgi:hypothetical protein
VIQDPSEIHGDSVKNVEREVSTYFGNTRRNIRKTKLMNLQRTVRTKSSVSGGINAFKRGYQSRSNLVKDSTGDLLANSHNILSKWKNFFSQLLNV